MNLGDKMSWQGAFDYCKNRNTSLMEIHEDGEAQLLSSAEFLYKNGIDSLWLGFKSKYIL